MTYKNARKSTKKIDIFASVGAAYVSPLSGFAPPWRVQYSLKKTKKETPSVRKTRFCWKMQVIGKKRGALVQGGIVDDEKIARIILDDFRNCRLGKISLEEP